MKYFVIANIFGYILTMMGVLFYKGVSFANLVKSLQLYIMLHFSAFFSFLNFFHLKSMSNFLVAVVWIILVLFAYYIYRHASDKYSLYLWCIFIFLWLLIGFYNPEFSA